MNEHLYEFLRITSGLTANEMWSYLVRTRRLKIAWPGVPDTREALCAGLEALAADGLAKKGGGGEWWWVPQRRQPVVEPKGERMLFA